MYPDLHLLTLITEKITTIGSEAHEIEKEDKSIAVYSSVIIAR